MAHAKVVLQTAHTYTVGGRTYKRGEPQNLSNPSEIAYLKTTAGFAVTMLGDPIPSPEPPPEPTPEPSPKPPPKRSSSRVKTKSIGEL